VLAHSPIAGPLGLAIISPSLRFPTHSEELSAHSTDSFRRSTACMSWPALFSAGLGRYPLYQDRLMHCHRKQSPPYLTTGRVSDKEY
jgi:hypothetical protein